DPHRREDPVETAWLHLKIGSHLKKVEGCKGVPLCICLPEVSIKDKEMGSRHFDAVTQALPVTEILIELWGQKTMEVLHRRAPSS
ncbi:MAG: hypothetical protein ACE5HH_04805, partial [Candidatus Hydrothermarchaeales archaeon]